MLEDSDLDISEYEDDGNIEETGELVPEELDFDMEEIEDVADVLESDDSVSINSDDEPLSELKKRLDAEKVAKKRMCWEKTDSFVSPNIKFAGNSDSSQDRREWEIKEYTNMYFDDAVFENICNCTNIRYLQEKGKPMNLTVSEVKKFFGISILMSCLKYPQLRMYWSHMTKVNIISNSMTRDRFFQIRANLKVIIDNDVSEDERKVDRLFKIRPLHERVKQGCLALPRYNEVAVDEQMIPFSGVCQMKQFVRGKPNPEGLKNFVCATPTGLILDFEIYQGKGTFLQQNITNLGVGPSAVIRLSETLLEGTHIFVDRYFTTMPLLEYMLQKNILVTGTIMKSRIPKAVNITSDKTMARIGRGSSEQNVRSDKKINVVQWYDMKNVLLMSTALQIEPQDTCRRWSKKDTKYINVSRPNIVKKYNECMGGIDLIDRMISYYRMGTRSKKWTVKAIFHLFDLGIANAWIFYRNDKKKLGDSAKTIMKYLDFKINVAECLLKDNDNAENADVLTNIPSLVLRSTSSPRGSPRISSNSGTKRKIQHLPIMNSDLKNSVRCKNTGCKGKTKVYCESCLLYLCFTGTNNCFRDFHIR